MLKPVKLLILFAVTNFCLKNFFQWAT